MESHYPHVPGKDWNGGGFSVYTEELVGTKSVWPALGWTGKNLQKTREKRKKVTNAISM